MKRRSREIDKISAYILAAGSSQFSQEPCSVLSFGNGMSILEWQCGSLKEISENIDISIAVGYEAEKIVNGFSDRKFIYAPHWHQGTALQSFLTVCEERETSALIMYGDTVFRSEIIKKFADSEADVVVGVDSRWRERFEARPKSDLIKAETITLPDKTEVEYTGLLKLSPVVMRWLLGKKHKYKSHQSFIDLIRDLKDQKFSMHFFDIEGAWAEMNYSSDLAQFVLGSKAETLARLRPRVQKSTILDQITISKRDWELDCSHALTAIQNKFHGSQLIIRSSAKNEDGWDTSSAGVFDSVLDIAADNTEAIKDAISSVFKSYDENDLELEVLIQPYLSDSIISGVVFTCDLVTGAPYYVINYDDTTRRTDVVTSGCSNEIRNLIVSKNHTDEGSLLDDRIIPLFHAIKELEELLGYDKLDVEFAIDSEKKCFVFQVRPIAVEHKGKQISGYELEKHLRHAKYQFNKLQSRAPHIFGDSTVFSQMTDWNPAEIIGSRPNPLALSLYNYIITEEVWSKQRSEFGYRDVFPSPLVYSFCGQPYVDCRASINSFIPKNLPDDTAANLVDAYISILREHPELHDKVELDVVFTVWTPTYAREANARFSDQQVTQRDISLLESELKIITANAITRLSNDLNTIETLSYRYEAVMKSEQHPIVKVNHLIEDCKKFGTLAFAHAARAGFIAITILKSFVKAGSISEERVLQFQSSIPTVTTELNELLSNDVLDHDFLLHNFGHLRPGTYDINQSAYWEDPKFYFQKTAGPNYNKNQKNKKFNFEDNELQAIKDFLLEISLDLTPYDLVNYLKLAIQSREKTKLQFTRNLSSAFDILVGYGFETLKMDRRELSYLTFEDIKSLMNGQLAIGALSDIVKLRKTICDSEQLAKLPSFIANEKDFYAFEHLNSKANFITLNSVISELVFIKEGFSQKIDGKVVAIPSADPGYDWIFSHNIAGLITEFGGANSHMAIRCAELDIPAAIGVGAKLYEALDERLVIVDCAKEILRNV